jgi:serine/threonine protein kinase
MINTVENDLQPRVSHITKTQRQAPGLSLNPPTLAATRRSTDIWNSLDFLHNRDPCIMHRDVKPGNFMITADYTALKLVCISIGPKL